MAGILYLYKISNNRKTESPLSHLKSFERLCGGEPYSRVILVTTMWEGGRKTEKEAREEELRNKHWARMISLGSKMVRYERTHESAWEIVNTLLSDSAAGT